jgi:ankyrin repeat protein
MDSGDTTLGAGATPLMRAARSGDAPSMRLLLTAGADPRLATRDGSNALMFAAGVGYRDKNTRGSESEALEALKVAIGAGLDLNEANSKGEMAIHGATLRGADTIVQFLVDNGAKLNAKTRQGFTALDVAMGKSIVGQLPVPKDSTVALVRKLGGLEGKDVN